MTTIWNKIYILISLLIKSVLLITLKIYGDNINNIDNKLLLFSKWVTKLFMDKWGMKTYL